MKEKIFLIHGLFMHGIVMQAMESRLEKLGYEVHTFSYRSVKNQLSENADALAEFVAAHHVVGGKNHFVGHSLGGLLIRLLYAKAPSYFSGRIVTLGTPHQGSEVAKRVAEDIHKSILGGSYENALDGDLPTWDGAVELGSIAGNKCIGIGMALDDLAKPNDGTVTVAETHLSGETDHVQLPLSHTALVYSKRAVKQTHHFLQHGYFASIGKNDELQ